MKVAELKQNIEPYKAAQLRRLVVEMYKAMPKSLKQGKGIDELICNPASGRKKQDAENGNRHGIPELGSGAIPRRRV